VSVSEVFSLPIRCYIKVNKRDNIGKQNGNTFTVASYEILIEPQSFESERVQLFDTLGHDLGVFSVMYPPEYLQAVQAVKIVV
jgi:hypothetical protein